MKGDSEVGEGRDLGAAGHPCQRLVGQLAKKETKRKETGAKNNGRQRTAVMSEDASDVRGRQ